MFIKVKVRKASSYIHFMDYTLSFMTLSYLFSRSLFLFSIKIAVNKTNFLFLIFYNLIPIDNDRFISMRNRIISIFRKISAISIHSKLSISFKSIKCNVLWLLIGHLVSFINLNDFHIEKKSIKTIRLD